MTNKHAPLCKLCGHKHFGVSHIWGSEKPTDQTPVDRTPVKAKLPDFAGDREKLINPDKIEPPNPHRSDYVKQPKNGRTYAKKTTLYKHNCHWCGVEFAGSYDKTYCSSACRQMAWRNFKKETHGITSNQGHEACQSLTVAAISWGRLRFIVLQRDKFRCRYCGAGADDGRVLHVDHIVPKSAGGSNELSNLVTACAECNLAKSNIPLEYNPFFETADPVDAK